jgi:hypothetical protein
MRLILSTVPDLDAPLGSLLRSSFEGGLYMRLRPVVILKCFGSMEERQDLSQTLLRRTFLLTGSKASTPFVCFRLDFDLQISELPV